MREALSEMWVQTYFLTELFVWFKENLSEVYVSELSLDAELAAGFSDFAFAALDSGASARVRLPVYLP